MRIKGNNEGLGKNNGGPLESPSGFWTIFGSEK